MYITVRGLEGGSFKGSMEESLLSWILELFAAVVFQSFTNPVSMNHLAGEMDGWVNSHTNTTTMFGWCSVAALPSYAMRSNF